MKYKKYKWILSGIIIGMLCTMTINVFADTNIRVSAFLKNNIKFVFGGEEKQLPSGYTVLNYQDRTYVPARFIAEELGAKVGWDDKTQTINITPPIVKEDPKKDQGDTEQAPTIDYKATPVSKSYIDMLVGISVITYDETNGYWRVYVKVENKEDTPIQLLPSETKLEVDGKEHDFEGVPLNLLDTKWYNDVRKDDTLEGYIVLPKLPKNAKGLHIEFTILKNDISQEKRKVDFDVLL